MSKRGVHLTWWPWVEGLQEVIAGLGPREGDMEERDFWISSLSGRSEEIHTVLLGRNGRNKK